MAGVVTLMVLGQMLDKRAAPLSTITLTAAIAVSFTAMAGLVLTGAPGHRVGRLMAAAGSVASLAVVAASWSGSLVLAWTSQWSWWPPFGLIVLALLLFPDGRLPSWRWRPLAVLIVTATGLGTAALAVAALDHPRTLLTTVDRTLTDRARLFIQIALLSAALIVAGLAGVVTLLWVRWRRADGETRHQLACLLAAGILFVVCLVLDGLGVTGAWVVTAVVVPAAITVAVLRYHLYDLDQVINRAIVWLVMTLLVIAGFVAIVTLLRTLVTGGNASKASLAATGLIAVAFEPLHRRVRRGVDHLLYGDRDDPYKVIARLGDLLCRTGEATAVLPLLARTIADSLQVPYVAVEIEGRSGPRIHVEHGKTTANVEAFSMIAHCERIGRLLVATRSPGSHFTRRECRLLENLALQAAVAAETTQLIRDLQESRERLVMAREEERRRLRRDLHDGLGPTLAGMAMQVSAARRPSAAPGRMRAILDDLASDLQLCTREVRELVDQLRPPALDRGLEAALRSECQRFTDCRLTVKLHVERHLDGLPAAVEVAAYRVLAEALANVARHSQAHTCRVIVRRTRELTMEIVDDGVGVSPTARRGVGLDSMRERAAELGGEFAIGPATSGGTSIRVTLPFAPSPTSIEGEVTGALACGDTGEAIGSSTVGRSPPGVRAVSRGRRTNPSRTV